MDLERDVVISLAQFDRSLLPVDQQHLDDIDFRFAVVDYLKEKYRKLGQHVEVRADLEKVVISSQATEDTILKALNAGNLQYGIELCDEILKRKPDHAMALYNSAMALSDLNHLDKAIERLEHLLTVQGRNAGANIHVALGVAYSRKQNAELGMLAFELALSIDPDNFHALRNLAGLYGSKGRNDEALDIFEKLAPMHPSDLATQLGYGETLSRDGQYKRACAVFDLIINSAPGSSQAQQAKVAKTAIANEKSERVRQANDGLRPDAVLYLKQALVLFRQRSDDQAKALFTEIALLGQSGFDMDSSECKYTLKKVPGKRFCGLQMVCMMYVGCEKFLDDGASSGIDLRAEYKVARLSS